MRNALAYLLVSFAVAGCGGGDGLMTGGDMATSGGNKDLSMAGNKDMTMPPVQDMTVPPVQDMSMSFLPFDSGVPCGNMICPLGQQCCVSINGMMASATCADSCDKIDGSIDVMCGGPENCGGNPCCANIQGGMVMGGVSCTQAMDACQPNIDVQKMSGMDRLCHVDDDCTRDAPNNTNLTQCCTLMMNGNATHVCLNALFAQFAGGTCP
jgi:hypothetical protein